MNEPEIKDYLPAVNLPVGSIIPQWWIDQVGKVPFVTSLPIQTDKKARIDLIAALNGEHDAARDWINREFEMVNYVCSPGEEEKENGEVESYVKTVLFLPDGKMIRFGSMGCLRSIMLFESLGRKAPWVPPLKVKLLSRTTKKGWNVYVLQADQKSLEARQSK